MLKVCALVPSYNESKTIGHLIKRIKTYGLDVVVIDDGSVDQTFRIAREQGADVLRNERNQGKGAALKAGFHYILDKDYDAVIAMDADGQHSPDDIPAFIHMAQRPDIDIVAGNRMYQPKNMPLVRWMTNSLMSFLISVICWQNIPDSQCGFRLLKRNVLKKLNPLSNNYEIESETIIEARHKGFKIKFIPIQTIYTTQLSQINPVVDTIRFFKFILKIFYPFLFNKR